MYVQGDQLYHIRRDFTREMDSQNGPCDHLHAIYCRLVTRPSSLINFLLSISI